MIELGCLRAAGWMVALLAACLAVPASGQAEPDTPPPQIQTSAFASSSPYSSVPELSPDGVRAAYSVFRSNRETIGIMDLDTGDLLKAVALEEGQYLNWMQWAGNGRLLLSVSSPDKVLGIEVRTTRMFVMQVATGELTYVGPRSLGLDGDDVIHLDPAGEFLLLSMQRNLFDEPQVWRFRLDGTDTRGEQVERRTGVWQWIADDEGVVRIGLGYDNNRLKVWYRKGADESFRIIARVDPDNEDELWDVVRLVSGSDEGLVLEPGESGRVALRRFNMATREVGEILYENPDWDVERLELDESGQPLAVHFTDDRPRVVWLNPEMAQLQARFEQALGKDRVRIVGRSRNGERMLVTQGDASDPGAWYLYTKAKRELSVFAELRPQLDPALLAPVRPVEYTARDGTRIRAYLTLPRGREARQLPLVVLPHGGPYYVRDSLKYSDEVQLLANRGYAVLQPNFRGSGGYGEGFVELGKGEMGRRMQDDLDDAVDWAAGEGLIDPQRVCLVGASYGGYAALWGVIRNPERYRCAASFAGVTAIDKQLEHDSDFFSRDGRRAWRERIRGTDRKFDIDTVSPARQAGRLQRPVLLAHGKKDGTVPFSQFETMRDALERAGVASAEFVVLEDSGHSFASAKDEQAWYDALVAFLARHNPPD